MRHWASVALLTLVLGLVACVQSESKSQTRSNEPVVGGGEAMEAAFAGMPRSLASRARIAPEGEPGMRLRLSGIVKNQDGSPAPGIIVYAYHTDRNGQYPRAETRHGRLRGWAKTDANGRYEFETIRPGAYPGGADPEHIHMHVIEPGRCTYWISDVRFADDPLLKRARPEPEPKRGGSGLATPTKEGDVWMVRRDIILGLNVPGWRAP